MAADSDDDRSGPPPSHVSPEDDRAEGYGCMVVLFVTLAIGVGLAIWGVWFN